MVPFRSYSCARVPPAGRHDGREAIRKASSSCCVNPRLMDLTSPKRKRVNLLPSPHPLNRRSTEYDSSLNSKKVVSFGGRVRSRPIDFELMDDDDSRKPPSPDRLRHRTPFQPPPLAEFASVRTDPVPHVEVTAIGPACTGWPHGPSGPSLRDRTPSIPPEGGPDARGPGPPVAPVPSGLALFGSVSGASDDPSAAGFASFGSGSAGASASQFALFGSGSAGVSDSKFALFGSGSAGASGAWAGEFALFGSASGAVRGGSSTSATVTTGATATGDSPAASRSFRAFFSAL